ncbi:MAG: CDP-diacylglycerol--glycerol-3-phosphate 3-phosphatidyltransferase [Nitrospinota bacterium]|nr:MAG: CDP-diacylglycerol--glycerol-3-phosphate 3-phosphatidyltransferase [Nitrospinota bacterium]
MTAKLNLPNRITLLRICLIPPIVVFLLYPSRESSFAAALMVMAASFTDWLDGHVARTKKQITTLGTLLDPVADKLLLVAALIPLVELHRVPSWMAVVLIGREVAVTGIRGISASHQLIIPAGTTGKYKMLFQMIALVALILDVKVAFVDFHLWGTLFLWVSMVLSIVSAVEYFLRFWEEIVLLDVH